MVFFFFKQKTAYGMRISDWSSDVCSSDLFEIAGKRLGADVVNMHAAQSSVKKGETLIDTAMTLNAMRADAIVIRHQSSGAVQLIADKVDCPVLNAGDGRHEHPTQALDGQSVG